MASLTTPGLLSLGAAAGFVQTATSHGDGLESLGGAIVGILLLAVAFPPAVILAVLGPLALAGFPLGAWIWIRLGRRLGRGLGDADGFRWRRWWARYAALSVLWVTGIPAVVFALAGILGA